MKRSELKSIIKELVEECLIQESHKIGDSFKLDGTFGLRDDDDEIIQYKGHHPIIDQLVGSIKITGENGSDWKVKYGNKELSIRKSFLKDYTSNSQRSKLDDEGVKSKRENDSSSYNKFKTMKEDGKKLKAKSDLYVKKQYGPIDPLLIPYGSGEPKIKEGSVKSIKSIEHDGVKINGFSYLIPFETITKLFTIV